ncbi:Bcr/CflA family multidrug efflux MFS transporter [Sinimarinibacterium sp. NLF-5-8]|uniref:Bcr/CflA family multidrug efflux MFS transporter n=1 Tax=Sinimarinibacterium sp. NLF-5-8 TaxID=2698684 RepID=UPI00192EAE23|nr:Bcr/CflA family multidrug efflux MFS transporter [Sinimarinibacterium sp. NLF-5-8]
MISLATHRRWIIILGIITAIGPMSIDMYLPALPSMQAHFGVSTGQIQLTLSIYFIGLAFGQLLYGPLADRFGRRALLLIGLGIYTVASVVCVLAPGIEVLSLGRLMQALGGCAGMVITRAMVRDRFEPEDTARIFAALVLVMGVAPILAPLVGGQLLNFFDWHSVFVVLTVFGALCWGLALTGLQETLAQRGEPIRLSAVLRGYARLLVDRRFMAYSLASGLASAGMFSYISGSAFVFIEVFGISPQHFGWYFGANAAGFVVVSQFNHRLLRRSTPDQLLRRALLAYAGFSVVLVALAASGIGGLWGVAVPLFLVMSSLGLIYPNATAMAMAPFGANAGLASAAMGTLQFTVAAVGGAAVGHLHDGTALPMAAVIAACALTAAGQLRVLAPVKDQ